MAEGLSLPHPKKPEYAEARNDAIEKLQPRVLKALGIEPYWYQNRFLYPPGYDPMVLKLVQMGGAKRTGKSFILATSVLPYVPLPRQEVRLYAVEHENAKREFDHIHDMLFDSPNALVKVMPELKEGLTKYQPDVKQGALEMRWSWGTVIKSRSWTKRTQWAGEPIDLGIICEPGFFDSNEIYSQWIEPNLDDRNGLCRSAGTVDNPWMTDYHDEAHDPDNCPDIFCVCEIPRWANTWLVRKWCETAGEDFQDKQARKAVIGEMVRRAKSRLTAREFGINWLGLWDVYADLVYEKWDKSLVKQVNVEVWRKLKQGQPGWDRFLALDTGGRFNACGEYVVNPKGAIFMIDEYTNYEYRSGKITKVDDRGFRTWFRMEVQGNLKCANPPVVYGDPSSHFKDEVTAMGHGWVDAENDHGRGANVVNEYMGRGLFHILRPAGTKPYKCEREIPRVRWEATERGLGGKNRFKRSGKDHSSDQVRYGLVMRPPPGHFEDSRPENTVEKDIAWVMDRKHDKGSPLFADMAAMGDPGPV